MLLVNVLDNLFTGPEAVSRYRYHQSIHESAPHYYALYLPHFLCTIINPYKIGGRKEGNIHLAIPARFLSPVISPTAT